jgi:hypothetical protein
VISLEEEGVIVFLFFEEILFLESSQLFILEAANERT